MYLILSEFIIENHSLLFLKLKHMMMYVHFMSLCLKPFVHILEGISVKTKMSLSLLLQKQTKALTYSLIILSCLV